MISVVRVRLSLRIGRRRNTLAAPGFCSSAARKRDPVNEPEQDGFELRNPVTETGRFLVVSAQMTDFGRIPWTLGVYAPAAQLAAPVRRLAASIAIGVLLIILSMIAAVILSRRIAAPVKTIAAAAGKVGDMNLDVIKPLPASHITELNDQARAFNQMLDALRWFETYVPRRLVSRLISAQAGAPVKSDEMELTVMFTDIFGFTAMSESLPASTTAELLNQHFTVLNRCIEETGGTLDKYIGDAVMAFWGAPDHQDDHAERACRAAVKIAAALSTADQPFRLKIAIHTGPLIVGNIGAPGRMNYTVIGDTVNVCSRIEELAGELDGGGIVEVLLSAETAALIGTEFTVEPAGEFQVKGREQPVQVYSLATDAVASAN